MVACPSGASVKPGLDPDTQILVDRSLWETVTGEPSSWFDWLLDIFIPSSIKASDLCALNLDDPVLPPVPNLGFALGGLPTYVGQLLEYMRLKLRYAAFAQACVCNSPAAFSCTTLLSHPYNPATTSGGVQDYGFGVEFIPVADCWCYGGYLQVSTVGSGLVQHGIVESGGLALSYLETVVPTTTDTAFFFATPQRLLAGHTYKYFYQFVGPGWVINYTTTNNTPTTNAFAQFTQHVYKNPIASAWLTHSPATTSPDPVFCPAAGTPPMPDVPAQPVDFQPQPGWSCTTIADLCARLFQINQKIDWLRVQVALDASRSDPYEYVLGTVHSGLTGSSTITVSDILGVLVELTTVPSGWGRTSATPTHYIPAPATLQIGTADGLGDAIYIHGDTQLQLPVSALATRVVCDFRAGVTGKVTEIARAPSWLSTP